MKVLGKLGWLLMLLSVAAMAAKTPETLASLKQRADAEPPGDKRIELCVKVAQHALQEADTQFNAGNTQQAQARVQDVVTYGLRAVEDAKSLRKRMKRTEIDIRKVTERMNDLKRSLAFDDRQPVAAAADKLDKARSDLLAAMFKKR